jgi:hypothetical protein
MLKAQRPPHLGTKGRSIMACITLRQLLDHAASTGTACPPSTSTTWSRGSRSWRRRNLATSRSFTVSSGNLRSTANAVAFVTPPAHSDGCARKREISGRDNGPERAPEIQLIDCRDPTVRANPREIGPTREEAANLCLHSPGLRSARSVEVCDGRFVSRLNFKGTISAV